MNSSPHGKPFSGLGVAGVVGKQGRVGVLLPPSIGGALVKKYLFRGDDRRKISRSL